MKISLDLCVTGDLASLDLSGDLSEGRWELLASIATDAGSFYDHAYAIHFDGRPVGCFGVWMHWESVGRAWTFLSDEAVAHPMALHRFVRQKLEAFISEEGMKRIEATVDPHHPAAIRWIERLGFQCEGLMRNYGPGGTPDTFLYARVN